MNIDFAYWLLEPQVWIIAGLVLVIADIFLGYGFFVLPIGVAAFLISALLAIDTGGYLDFKIFDSWRDVMIWFSILSVVSIGVLRLVFQKYKSQEKKDINDY
jgi:membrane protein implicated in regulation of membrane protease activity